MCSVTFDWRENDAMRKVEKFEKTMKENRGDLLWATVEFTELCNHRCIYCYENAGPRKNYRIMEKEKMEKLMNYFGEQKLKQLTCSGGEPLMYPMIKEAVRLARENGMVVHMITNGYFLTKERARELFQAGLSQVQINIDSIHPEKHDRIRGKKGSFRRATRALKNAREAGMTCVTQTVLLKENEQEIIDIFKLARKIGVERCRVWDIVPSEGRAWENMKLRPSSNYVETLKKITDFACNTGAVNIESGDPLFHNGIEKRLPITGGYCPYSIGLLANYSVGGDSYFCCTNRAKPMYNVFNAMKNGENLKIVHSRALMEFLREIQYFNLPDECRECSFFGNCKGGCFMRRRFAGYEKDYWCKVPKKSTSIQASCSSPLLYPA